MELCLKVDTTESKLVHLCTPQAVDRSDSQVSFYRAAVLAKSVPFIAEVLQLYTPALLRLLRRAISAAETTYRLCTVTACCRRRYSIAERMCLTAQVCEVDELLALTVLMTATAIMAVVNVLRYISFSPRAILQHPGGTTGIVESFDGSRSDAELWLAKGLLAICAN